MNTMIKIGLATGLLSIAWIGIKHVQHTSEPVLTIGIVQTASHPALDLARRGFEEHLQQECGSRIRVIRQNAEGSIANAHMIAQSFHVNSSINAILTIATPATQVATNIEKEKPIIFSVVTDPNALGLFETNHNVCGSSDMIDIVGLVNMLKKLVPQAHKVAILFNPAEANSQVLVQQMNHELRAVGIEALEVGITAEADVTQAVTIACQKADALLAPTDNLIATAIQNVASIALKNKKPLLVSDNLLVSNGALAARGIDFKECGKQAAVLAIDVLIHGKKPNDLAIVKQTQNTIVINKKVLQQLNLCIPKELEHEKITWI